jgi:uncharacterized protein (TIGR00297 family)
VAATGAAALGLTGLSPLWQHGVAWATALPAALLVNLAFAGAAFAARTVTSSGAMAGLVVGTTLFATLGWRAWLLLGCSWLVAMTTTAAGRRQKEGRGIGEARRGQRAAGHVLANTGAAAIVAIVAAGSPGDPALVAGFAAALATGASDTAASEIGKAVGGRTWLLPSFDLVAPGTLGAASTAGTIAGVLSACLFGMVALGAGLVHSWLEAAIISLAATIALVAEGPLAVATEGRGLLDNDGVNFVSSVVGATLAVTAARVALSV